MSYSSPFFLNHTSFFSALQLLCGPDSLSMSLFGQSCFHSYGMKTQLFAPLYCRWQVWVWKEAKWNVDCIFFWPLPYAFCVHFWFSRMSFLFQNFSWGIKKYFTFKTEPQSGHFTMPLFQRKMIWKLSASLINSSQNRTIPGWKESRGSSGPTFLGISTI